VRRGAEDQRLSAASDGKEFDYLTGLAATIPGIRVYLAEKWGLR
jgi:hypothetical protein